MGTPEDPADSNRAYEVETGETTPVGPGLGSTFDPHVVDFGHYSGRTLQELAETDPGYLYWLARHPSGARYREEIARVLANKREPAQY
jgi:Exodeoxyribonuclease X-like C-terminal